VDASEVHPKWLESGFHSTGYYTYTWPHGGAVKVGYYGDRHWRLSYNGRSQVVSELVAMLLLREDPAEAAAYAGRLEDGTILEA